MSVRARKLLENNNYRQLGFNCSKFVTRVLKSGVKRIYGPLKKSCRIQMPENALRYARELQNMTADPMSKVERNIKHCRDLDCLRRLHEDKVVHVKESLRYRLKYFLCRLIGFKAAELYRSNQVEKFIVQHIMGSHEIKNALFNELESDKSDDARIMKLLSLLRLDVGSVERMVKLNDSRLLDFYLKYFREDVNRRINKRKETMLLCAVRNQANNIVRALLERDDTDKSVCDLDGNTYLILAAKKGNEAVVKLRMQANPDISETNKYGKTAIAMAKKYHHYKSAQLLEAKKNEQTHSAVLVERT